MRGVSGQRNRRTQPEVEPLESRLVPTAGLEHQLAANMIDPTGQHDGVQRVSWSEPGTPTTVTIFLNTRTGANTLTPAQKARIRASMVEINRGWDGVNGVRLIEVGNMTEANIRVQNSGTSRIGGRSQGVFGLADYYTFDTGLRGRDGKVFHRFVGAEFGTAYQASVIMITGWNWYAGARAAGIGRGQYDYQTIVTHELAHAVGLQHDSRTYAGLNGDGKSAMLPWGMAGRPHRRLSANDVASLRYLYAGTPAPSDAGNSPGNAARLHETQTPLIGSPRGVATPALTAHALAFACPVAAWQFATGSTTLHGASMGGAAQDSNRSGPALRRVERPNATSPHVRPGDAHAEPATVDSAAGDAIEIETILAFPTDAAAWSLLVQSQVAAQDDSLNIATSSPDRRDAGAAVALAFLLPAAIPSSDPLAKSVRIRRRTWA